MAALLPMRRAAAAKGSEATGSARAFANAGLGSAGLTALSVRAKPCIDCACPRWPVNRHSSLRGVGKFLIESELSVTVFEEHLVGDESPCIPAAYHSARIVACKKKPTRIIVLFRCCSLFLQPILAMSFGMEQALETIVPQHRHRQRRCLEVGWQRCRLWQSRPALRSRHRSQRRAPCSSRRKIEPKRHECKAAAPARSGARAHAPTGHGDPFGGGLPWLDSPIYPGQWLAPSAWVG